MTSKEDHILDIIEIGENGEWKFTEEGQKKYSGEAYAGGYVILKGNDGYLIRSLHRISIDKNGCFILDPLNNKSYISKKGSKLSNGSEVVFIGSQTKCRDYVRKQITKARKKKQLQRKKYRAKNMKGYDHEKIVDLLMSIRADK